MSHKLHRQRFLVKEAFGKNQMVLSKPSPSRTKATLVNCFSIFDAVGSHPPICTKRQAMGKRSGRSPKRKASEALLLDGATLSSSPTAPDVSECTPEMLADTLLSWLPAIATNQNAHSKKLLKAFDLVRSKLQHRANVMANESIQTGGTRDIMLADKVALPPDTFAKILDYLPKHEAVRSASMVSKSWLSVVRSPHFWDSLDNNSGLLEMSSTVLNGDDLLRLLKNPMFASIKRLIPPDRVQSRKKLFEQIAKSCPLLEELDCGFRVWSNMKLDDSTLLKLPKYFPHLKSITFNMYHVTGSVVADFCRIMGERLVSLCVRDNRAPNRQLSDENIKAIADSCVNLERFSYESVNDPIDSFLSEKGVIDLLRGCRNLKRLALIGTDMVGTGAFEHIVKGAPNLESLFVVQHPNLEGSQDLRTRLKEQLQSFEILSGEQHCRRETDLHKRFRPTMYW